MEERVVSPGGWHVIPGLGTSKGIESIRVRVQEGRSESPWLMRCSGRRILVSKYVGFDIWVPAGYNQSGQSPGHATVMPVLISQNVQTPHFGMNKQGQICPRAERAVAPPERES